jgi:hypothetical protein
MSLIRESSSSSSSADSCRVLTVPYREGPCDLVGRAGALICGQGGGLEGISPPAKLFRKERPFGLLSVSTFLNDPLGTGF